jgi:hypothetical protein
MALSQVFEVSENQGGTILYLDDETGDYNVSTNPGGYGSPNTARADLALILIAKYKATSEDIEIDANTYDPESVTQWTFESLEGDGRYQFNVYSVARKTGAETPVTNDFVYDFTANELQRWNGSSWVAAENSELEDNDVAHSTTEHAHIPDLYTAHNRIAELLVTGCSVSRSDLFLYQQETIAVLNGSLAIYTAGNYAEFQDVIEKYQSRVDQLIALT